MKNYYYLILDNEIPKNIPLNKNILNDISNRLDKLKYLDEAEYLINGIELLEDMDNLVIPLSWRSYESWLIKNKNILLENMTKIVRKYPEIIGLQNAFEAYISIRNQTIHDTNDSNKSRIYKLICKGYSYLQLPILTIGLHTWGSSFLSSPWFLLSLGTSAVSTVITKIKTTSKTQVLKNSLIERKNRKEILNISIEIAKEKMTAHYISLKTVKGKLKKQSISVEATRDEINNNLRAKSPEKLLETKSDSSQNSEERLEKYKNDNIKTPENNTGKYALKSSLSNIDLCDVDAVVIRRQNKAKNNSSKHMSMYRPI